MRLGELLHAIIGNEIEILRVSASGFEPDFPARRRRGAPAVAIDYGHGRGHCSRTDSFATSSVRHAKAQQALGVMQSCLASLSAG